MKSTSNVPAILFFAGCVSLSSAWTTIHPQTLFTTQSRGRKHGIIYSTQTDADTVIATESISSTSSTSSNTNKNLNPYMDFGILISSFTDGMMSPTTRAFCKYSLASLLTMDAIQQTQEGIEESVKFSPCQGPDVDLLNQLEQGDSLLEASSSSQSEGKDAESKSASLTKSREEKTEQMMKYLKEQQQQQNDDNDLEIRVLYIPTAMYALRADSKNSPGKQRQRARADGKKRRNQLVNYLQNLFSKAVESESDGESDSNGGIAGFDANILAVTLDLADGSIKQPVGSDDSTKFPKDGKAALTTWSPHVVYLEGGNTFWLHHCMEKGDLDVDWMQLIKDACVSEGANRPALYIGKSAGAIVAGKYVETATWKGWDDPSVVPGKETYDDWRGDKPSFGLNLVGDASFFPHMSDDWDELVEEKRSSLPKDSALYCLREWDAFCVEGSTKDTFISA